MLPLQVVETTDTVDWLFSEAAARLASMMQGKDTRALVPMLWAPQKQLLVHCSRRFSEEGKRHAPS